MPTPPPEELAELEVEPNPVSPDDPKLPVEPLDPEEPELFDEPVEPVEPLPPLSPSGMQHVPSSEQPETAVPGWQLEKVVHV